MTLTLSPHHLAAIQAHAERTYPNECCGLMLGTLGSNGKTLIDLWHTENDWSPEVADDPPSAPSLTKARRYWIAPEAMLAAMKAARSRNLDVIGIYHSHPDNSAQPSECDRRQAWPQYSYVIVSVAQGRAVDTRSWILDDDQQFQSEPVHVMASSNRASFDHDEPHRSTCG